ncbi:MAG: hypothetical protein DWQ07_14045 [Chloroflexi bacterium]|nr:MAG: hypothetical protein DWQ07_14045 [Chloroflexota bacterium]
MGRELFTKQIEGGPESSRDVHSFTGGVLIVHSFTDKCGVTAQRKEVGLFAGPLALHPLRGDYAPLRHSSDGLWAGCDFSRNSGGNYE